MRTWRDVVLEYAAMSKLVEHTANAAWQSYMSDLLLPWENGETAKRIPEAYCFVSS
ncbi:hypothetical protein GRF59_08830 [Paenibacillus sp. HJL G12]|uniref:Uncharacterized protein n=1 Tax=Paenibacillus dendrobii TaxID=2691084 RepID=A0A7X3II27_9BACL|nr:hypothetical protein [Paenibacillus dendrobii]MWV43741.1 hypothetical protein [Paenibacillus dendrobii]